MASTLNFESSQDRDRFIRLTRLLIAGGTPILRAILKQHHTPASLARALGGTGTGFNKPQKLLLFPPSGLPDFDKFDISLIFKLLRNWCGLTEPATKWNGFPAESDISLEADIVRIDFCRNEIYGHVPEHMGLTRQEFDQYWKIISDTLCRRALYLLEISVTTELQNKIQRLKWAPLTDDDRRTFESHIESILVEQGKKLDNIEAKEDQIKEGIEGLQDTMINALQRTKISDKTSTAAAPSVQLNVLTINQISPNYSSERAQFPQPGVPQGIRRQVSDSTISYSSPQRPYKKSYSLPSKVGHRTPSWQERSENSVDRFFSRFPIPQTADKHHLWQSPNQTPASEPFREPNSASFYAGQEKFPARFSQQRSGNPEELSFQFQNPRADAEYQASSHGQQSLNPTAAPFTPHGVSNDASFYVGQDSPPDLLADQAAAPRTWPSPSNHSFYHTTSKDRQASPVSPRLAGSNEWPRQQQQQQLHQDPLLRINIFVSGADLSGFHLSKVVQSVMDTSNEGTDASQFTSYLEKHQLVIKKIEGDGVYCCIGVSPGDLEFLEDLWHDFIHRDLREFVKETVLPEDFTGEVDVDIDAEEYKRCCKSLRPRGFKDSGRQLHSQSLSQVGLAFNDVTEPTPETIHMRSQSAMDLRSTVTDASQELFQLICKNGGRMDWQTAIASLPYSSRSEFTKTAIKQNRQFEFLPNNVVQVKVSLKFCPKMRKDSTCNNTLCPDLHLCRYHFLEGRCQFPTNCKNSHDISDNHTNNVLKLANLSFLDNEERKRLLCNVAYVAPEICFYYNKSAIWNSCTKRANCPYLHVCRDWVLVGRTCVAGIACQRAHTFSNQHEQDILKKRNLDQLSEEEILQKLNEHYN